MRVVPGPPVGGRGTDEFAVRLNQNLDNLEYADPKGTRVPRALPHRLGASSTGPAIAILVRTVLEENAIKLSVDGFAISIA
jgi:hypothetical protein